MEIGLIVSKYYKSIYFPLQSNNRLPFLVGMYKAHKEDFRWITIAHNCMFSNITNMNVELLKALTNKGLIEVTNNLHKKLKF